MNLFSRNKVSKDNHEMKNWIKSLFEGPILQTLPIKNNADILELGSGTGDFTFCIADYLSEGHVYACDVNEKNIHKMTESMSELDYNNITISNCREGNIRLPKEVDWAIAFLTANKVIDIRKMVGNLKDNVKSGGSVVIIDWDKSQHKLAPRLSHQVDGKTIQRLMMQEDLRPTVKHLPAEGLYVIIGIKS